MTAIADKLVRKGVDADDAALLEAAGYTTPALIRAAEDVDIEDVIGESETTTLRQVLPLRE